MGIFCRGRFGKQFAEHQGAETAQSHHHHLKLFVLFHRFTSFENFRL
jgi:hypothetical protein